MIKEESKAGIKEFVFVLIWAGVLTLAGDWLRYIMPSYKVFGTVTEIVMFCVLAFFVLTRYSAVYTYMSDKNIFRANRKIGKRNKETEIKGGQLSGVQYKRPSGGIKVYNMCRYVFPNRNVRYLVYETSEGVCAVRVGISDKMSKEVMKLKKERK